jgi:hypothetical protein
VNYAALAAAEQPPPPIASERIHALLLNGSGEREQNYASHLEHIRDRRDDAATTLKSLLERADAGHALAYRTEVRISALIRMGTLLSSIAGRVYRAT